MRFNKQHQEIESDAKVRRFIISYSRSDPADSDMVLLYDNWYEGWITLEELKDLRDMINIAIKQLEKNRKKGG